MHQRGPFIVAEASVELDEEQHRRALKNAWRFG
jgi:hypothetical protein